MNKRVLFVGGSPCSGKSTVAERISKHFDNSNTRFSDITL
ncbi:MAG: hypothetical protein HDR01_06945 [Lachnospiraceae bacterium]|nr:hypothetical protein [Lachnospiraceae bacterium]